MTRRRLAAALATAAAVAVTAVACSQEPAAPSNELPHDLAQAVTVDAMFGHLRKLQEIADANGGNRAQGTPGYDASLDYVAGLLRDKGFEVETPEFERLGTVGGGNPSLTVSSQRFSVEQASLLVPTPDGGLNAPTLRPGKPAGCAASDYKGVTVKGAISVVDDTGCSIVVKQNVALAEGAVGLLVVSTSRPSPAGLFTSGYYGQLKVPVGVIDKTADAALRRTTRPVRLVLDNKAQMVKSRNLLAQTKTGSTDNVVVVGAHLDSIAGGPGINDNGSGVSAILETALQLGGSPAINNAVRFAFWGAEETGLEGSSQYIRKLSPEQLDELALYLNFDMLGSTNTGYFTYDGDQSAQAGDPKPVPEGSAGVERTLAGFLNLQGVRPADMPLSANTDYSAFMNAGVPIGGATTGSSQRKTEVQARLWGGKSGVAFDPNYHTRRDNIDNVDAHALSVMGPAVAFAVGTYALSTDGPNGVPGRDQRKRS
ncbi:M28 family peptidase [Mycolicibacterium smegmatis]|uniref:Aminopeptidase Y Metallo peptidase MEROPS family M28A n=3 Tax=Mycolicibacterium smegmatis TaxID=1772 RepID=I7FEE7_MYCS2|nr:M28 family peptidase [Mycolicibacterium smegmatis]ABK70886.1 leupeptin-inactivating enzyme 1 [Mycolicibacterium smegmatis MC2 155]AFP37268.1 Aminopeptidase Y Metallo peptidase MEROPS family M28A [Mycolicibacterium smegmatis MC2 155]AIU06067.1 peptidase M28 [Mycolicibacterium smegmatis MC2 155]AIU12692.1 peptidase M28 [Mycolicibacterium smegmatis]AIU19316.1 peptidase M28 [Mycolicibacterium smegmatis]